MGYASWSKPYLFDHFYVDDGFLVTASLPIKVNPSTGVNLLVSRAGTATLQKPFRGSKAPDGYERLVFKISMKADSESDFYVFRRIKAKGAAVNFSPGMRMTDIFQATSGEVYTLSRPLASSVVPGVNETTHPTTILLDGVSTPSAATVVGQAVTANSTGEIEVQYTPLFKVAVLSTSEQIAAFNDYPLEVELSELIQGVFQ